LIQAAPTRPNPEQKSMAGTTISTSGTVGIKITTAAEEPVVVTASGTINTSGKYAIYNVASVAGTLTNDGLLSATASGAVAVDFAGGGLVTNAGTIIGGAAGIYMLGNGGASGSVTNSGIIKATGTSSSGIQLHGGGDVTNGSASKTTATIIGAQYGVFMHYGSGAIGNFGTIDAAGTTGAGIRIGDAGDITNGSGSGKTALIQGATGILLGGTGTVINDGSIVGRLGDAVLINGGGTVANGAVTETGRLIKGVTAGIYVYGRNSALGTVTNFGAITATGSAGIGVALRAGGDVTNGSATVRGCSITGTEQGVFMRYGSGEVLNYGTIHATGTTGAGVQLGGSAVITNGAGTLTTWLIEGASGVVIGDGATITNDGTILGQQTDGVLIGQGGTIANGATTETGRIIEGISAGIYMSGNNSMMGTVTNFGTIIATGSAGIGVALHSGGDVANGSAKSTGWLINGVQYGVSMRYGSGTVTNLGTICASGPTGAGVRIAGTADVVNGSGSAATWLIEGATGVAIGASGTVINDGTIEGKTGAGVSIGQGGRIANGGATQTGRVIEGVTAGVYVDGGNNITGTVSNFGTISASGAAGIGVALRHGGDVINGAVNSTGWLIAGAQYGVFMHYAAGEIINNGTIRASNTTGAGVQIGGDASVINGSGSLSAWLIEGATGIGISGTGTIANDGTIKGAEGAGISVGDGGKIANGSASETGRIIEGVSAGIYLHGGNSGLGTITNFGTISASSGTGAGIALREGGTVANGDTASTGWSIVGGQYGVQMRYGSGDINNYGTIHATGTTGAGIEIGDSGDVTNGSGSLATWLIEGATGIAIGSTGTIINDGTIKGAEGAGISVGQGGMIANGSATETRRIIAGVSAGIYFHGGNNITGTITNYGAISASGSNGVGIALRAGGDVANGTAKSIGWSITGVQYGVEMRYSAGSVGNFGIIRATGTTGAGIEIGATGNVTNGSGSATHWVIEGATGIAIGGTGTVTNDGTIIGYQGNGIAIGGAATVTNDGTIAGDQTDGIDIGNGGTVANGSASETGRIIKGVSAGIYMHGGSNMLGTVSNFGTISASAGEGVLLRDGGDVTNGGTAFSGTAITGAQYGVWMRYGSGNVQNYGAISGLVGIDISGTGTVVNAGTISSTSGASGTAIDFGSNKGVVVEDAGSVIVGKIVGAGTMDLAAGGPGTTGDLSGVGTLAIASGAHWTLDGTNTVGDLADAGILSLAAHAQLTITGAIEGENAAARIQFLGAADLSLAFSGPLAAPSPAGLYIQDFSAGDTIVLNDATASGLSLAYTATTGDLQLERGASVLATLHFQTSSLGQGAFHLTAGPAGQALLTLD